MDSNQIKMKKKMNKFIELKIKVNKMMIDEVLLTVFKKLLVVNYLKNIMLMN